MLISLIAGFTPTMITYYKAIIFSIFLHKYFLFFEIIVLFVALLCGNSNITTLHHGKIP